MDRATEAGLGEGLTRGPDDLLFDRRIRAPSVPPPAASNGCNRGQRATRGLSPGALDILIRLSENEDGISIKDLARSTGVSSRNVTGPVDTLETGGLAARIPAPHDRRSVLVRITPSGTAWLDEFRRPTQAAMAALFRGFTPAETTLLRHLCLRVTENQQQLTRYLEEQT